MAKRKKVATTAATNVANCDPCATPQVGNSSPATSSKKGEKKPTKKAAAKPTPETREVCFTDQKTGKRFCGEMTEVPAEKTKSKVAGSRRRKRK